MEYILMQSFNEGVNAEETNNNMFLSTLFYYQDVIVADSLYVGD